MEKQSAKEELKVHKKTIFDLQETIRNLEKSQNQSLIDAMGELKSKTRQNNQLEEENQKLHLEVQLLLREKEAFEHRLQEQEELAVLRERNLQKNNS